MNISLIYCIVETGTRLNWLNIGSKGIDDVPPAGSLAYTPPSRVAIQFLVTHPTVGLAQ